MGLTLSRSFDVIKRRQSADDFWIDMKYENYFALLQSVYKIHVAARGRVNLNLVQRLKEPYSDHSFLLLPTWRPASRRKGNQSRQPAVSPVGPTAEQ
jgi:hypothetical protein